MVVRQQKSGLLFVYLAVVTCGSAQTDSTVPTVGTITARMVWAQAANRARFRPYLVTRHYELYGEERHKTTSQVIADVTFVPPNVTAYAIRHTSGTGMAENIVRRILESEAAVVKDCGSTDISPDNYDFRFIREEDLFGQRCYVLELLPRRKDKYLLRGKIWVDANTYMLHRTEGEPAKGPSWWVKDVRISLLYGDVGGMWLQTASEGTANVRILGHHTMVSRDVEYKISELVSAGSAAETSFQLVQSSLSPGAFSLGHPAGVATRSNAKATSANARPSTATLKSR